MTWTHISLKQKNMKKHIMLISFIIQNTQQRYTFNTNS